MAGSNMIARVRNGMTVKSADGIKLGKIVQVWCGSDPVDSSEECDDAICSHLEIHRGFLGTGEVVYIPCYAVANVLGRCVTLSTDAATVMKRWHGKPSWVPAHGKYDDIERRMDEVTVGRVAL